MKTKTLLAAGLLMAATAASSFAQTVYSINAVGFVNLVFPSGFSIASNPLEGATNTVSVLFPSVPNGTSVFKFDSATGGYTGSTYLFGSWNNPSLSLVPGEGFFFKNPGATALTNTFVGNVKQGALTTPLSAGFSLVGSQVPQSGLVSTDLGVPIGNAESVFKFDASIQGYTGGSYLFGSWSNPGEPTINVGEGFFVKKNAAANWTRTFSVNQ
ncbi:MAG: hypothetical protein HZA92_05740 [Verrucomicrobia bacterium]|nr:hypothetical protein [Verrucomicrobiota bacterium]